MRAALLTVALATPAFLAQAAEPCAWNAGSNRFVGSPRLAIARMDEIPLQRRALLAVRAGTSLPTDKIRIYKDRIESAQGVAYQPGIFSMHFGRNQVCDRVGLAHWPTDHFEPADVWCVASSCVAIPRVCGNVARVFLADLPTLPGPVRRVSEPSTLALLGAACCMAGLLSWRKRQRGRNFVDTRADKSHNINAHKPGAA